MPHPKIILGVNNLCTNIRVCSDLLGLGLGLVSDIAIFVLQRDVKLQLTNLGLGLVSGSSLAGVCRHLAAVVWITYTTVVYTTVVSIVDLWSIHDGRVRSMQAHTHNIRDRRLHDGRVCSGSVEYTRRSCPYYVRTTVVSVTSAFMHFIMYFHCKL